MILPPNSAPIRGQSAIAEFWRGGWKAGVRNVVLETTEVSVQGNTAYEVGTAQLEMRKPDGSLAGKDTGKYIVIWKRNSAGAWQWYRDIWNSSLPEAGAK
jgi:ketosteroid isomerase-like protein